MAVGQDFEAAFQQATFPLGLKIYIYVIGQGIILIKEKGEIAKRNTMKLQSKMLFF